MYDIMDYNFGATVFGACSIVFHDIILRSKR